MIAALAAGALAAAAGVSLSVALWYLVGGGGGRMQRRVEAFVKGGAQAQQRDRAADLAGGRRRAAAQVAVTESKNPLFRRLERMADRAQASLRPQEALGIGAAFGVGFALLAGIALDAWYLVIPLFFLGFYMPIFWMRRRYGQLKAGFHKQLSDTTTLLASAVRAGNALPRAFERVGAEAPEPTASAFRQAVREMGLGLPLEEALERISERYPSEEMELLVASVNVQYQVGGNLAKVLELIADTLRERARMRGDIKSLTATQRYSAYLMSGLPVFVVGFLFLVSPAYISVLFHYPYFFILLAASLMVLMGFFLMQQLAKVDI